MIRVQNIYYMLAYAFSVLREDSYQFVATEEFDHNADLFAAILAKGISNQIKRGLGREYISITDSLRFPTGKIDVSASVKQQTLLKKQLICKFDTYTENTYINRILKTTAMLLLHSTEVAVRQKQAIKQVMRYFSNVEELNPSHIQWSSIQYHRNNATYKMLINICYLILSVMLLTEQNGTKKLSKFIDDQHMHRLYEKFILQYYRKHFPEFHVSPAQIDWNLDDGVDAFFPLMKTDITIEYQGRTFIIDAKYYSHTMQTNSLYNNQTLHSGNLYQIFTYVKNKDREADGKVSGVLLYAKTEEEITPDCEYRMGGSHIGVKTLDLNTDFSKIEIQLNGLIDTFLIS